MEHQASIARVLLSVPRSATTSVSTHAATGLVGALGLIHQLLATQPDDARPELAMAEIPITVKECIIFYSFKS